MAVQRMICGAACLAALAGSTVGAQQPPAVRKIGRLERMSTESLASVSTALAMPGGTVMINDTRGRRLLLLDSTLAVAKVIADTTSATDHAYSARGGTLIRYRGDTAMFIDPASLSMFVVGPMGNTIRVMAVPRGQDAQSLYGYYGTPGFDARGRLTYFGNTFAVLQGVMVMLWVGSPVSVDGKPTGPAQIFNQHTDSAFIVRADLGTRGIDTAATIRIAKIRRELKGDAQGLLTAIEATPDPLPLIDEWAVTPDGVIAVVRGRDYHVDWIMPDGKVTSSPKMPFDWQRISDERKQVLIDSAVKAQQASFDGALNARSGGGGSRGGSSGGGGRGGSNASATGQSGHDNAPNVAVPPSLSDVPDYVPPFTPGAVRADDDGNLWIRTSTLVDGQPVYDIVNRRGELFDRVQLPTFRTIAGFGPGVVYMAFKDANGVVHLERARVK